MTPIATRKPQTTGSAHRVRLVSRILAHRSIARYIFSSDHTALRHAKITFLRFTAHVGFLYLCVLQPCERYWRIRIWRVSLGKYIPASNQSHFVNFSRFSRSLSLQRQFSAHKSSRHALQPLPYNVKCKLEIVH